MDADGDQVLLDVARGLVKGAYPVMYWAHEGRPPSVLCGRIESPSDQDGYTFEAKAGDKFSFEVFARRADSGLDPIIRILNDKGAALAEADDMSGTGSIPRTVCLTAGPLRPTENTRWKSAICTCAAKIRITGSATHPVKDGEPLWITVEPPPAK